MNVQAPVTERHRAQPRRPLRLAGFTLIELLIAVAIVAVLGAVAYPSYREHVAKGKRARAAAQLVGAQQWMERRYSENYTYLKTDGSNTSLPTNFQTSPPTGEGAADYNISLPTTQSATTYTLTATRTGAMANDRCGNLTINNLGQKSIASGTHSGFPNLSAAIAYCWR
jgi:type IV pilus assembly protein PilE